jgi:hypothetical protein
MLGGSEQMKHQATVARPCAGGCGESIIGELTTLATGGHSLYYATLICPTCESDMKTKKQSIGHPFRADAPTRPFSIRVTDAELLAWRAKAQQSGMSLGEWIRARCGKAGKP